MTDYIITEELYLLIRSDLYNDGRIDRYHQLKREARPLSDHDAEIRRQERERVLDEAVELFFNNPVGRKTNGDEVKLMDEILEMIQSLRGAP